MKATGIIRHIDDLGRVVIPMELRRTLGIRTGDPIEIFTDDGGLIVMRKYDMHTPMLDMVENLMETVQDDAPEHDGEIIEKLSEIKTLLAGAGNA